MNKKKKWANTKKTPIDRWWQDIKRT
jgi:hypothetical protein